ncbi:MAG TPA: hypothetical protein VLA93_05545 [Pyrinomonadaceae bacterium]|nr:hypothetical protein [Pyrinomonadaceae bacterium]
MANTKELFPGTATTYDVLQQVINDFDEVLLHPRDQNGARSTFDIGANRILVTKPTIIKGVVDPRWPDEKPVIMGSSGWLVLDNAPDGYPGTGIFSIIGPKDLVEIINLRLEHTPDRNPQGESMHGTATVAYFADNNHSSGLKIANCELVTAATSAISFDAINPLNENARKHDVTIEGCTINGKDHPDTSLAQFVPGNYIGVRLGALLTGRPPIDMRNSRFEVKQCTVDSAKFAGVVGAFFETDGQSEFVIEKNTIGHSPNSSLEVTRVGIIFLNASVMDPTLQSWPAGKITLRENRINLQGYFDFPWPQWSGGIFVNVNSDLAEKLETTIDHNTIDFSQPELPNWPSNAMELVPDGLVLDGIFYQDEGTRSSKKVSAVIRDNTLVASGTVKPLLGIALRKGAHHVKLDGNDLTNFTASHAQIFLAKQSHNCVIRGNVYGGLGEMNGANYTVRPVAVVLCDGDENELSCTHFTGSGVPGWTLDPQGQHYGGPGRVKLDRDSELDKVQLDPVTFSLTPQKTVQWWNASQMPNNKNNVYT